LTEIVTAKIVYPAEIQAGARYSLGVDWKYRRITESASHEFAVSETVANENVIEEVTLRAPARFSLSEQPQGIFNIDARIKPQSGPAYAGDELLLTAWLKAPNGRVAKIPLHDDGIVDSAPNDGWFSGRVDIFRASQAAGYEGVTGIWTVYALGQTVNAATPDMAPMEAAAFIGGDPVVAPLALSFGGNSCNAGPSVTIEVVR
jgi:hypothetical protein